MTLSRRGLLLGAIAAPAIVHASSLMPIFAPKRPGIPLDQLAMLRKYEESELFAAYVTALLHEIAKPLGIPYAALGADYRPVPFSLSRELLLAQRQPGYPARLFLDPRRQPTTDGWAWPLHSHKDKQ